jgi:hypothetical protein
VSLDSDVTSSLRQAGRAWELFNAAMQAYSVHLLRYDWESAEAERPTIEAALDSYLNALAAAKRRVQHEESRNG